MEESPAFFLEAVAAVSPCSTSPLSRGSPGGLATTQASFSLRDAQERIYFCCFQSPRLWGFVQAVRLPAVGPSPASSLSSPVRPAASWGCGVRALLGMAGTSGWAWGSAQPPGPFSLGIVNQGEEAGGWGTCVPTQSPRLRPHCLAFPDDAGIQVGTTARGCEAGARAQRGSPAGRR